MMKKKYAKPSMKVFQLPGKPMIVCYSGGGLGQIHDINDDLNNPSNIFYHRHHKA